jgi:hypothetical protein
MAKDRERGAAVVEFALVLPLLVTVLFGAIDFGFVSNDTTKLRQVVREAGRRASVWRFGRSICDNSPSGGPQRGRLVGNHVVGSSNQIPKPVFGDPDTRVFQARLLQCQLHILGLESGLDLRTKIVVASFPAESMGADSSSGPAKPFRFELVNADPNPPIDPLVPTGPRSSDIGRIFDDRNSSGIKDPGELESDVSFTVVVCAQYRTNSRTGFFGPLLNKKILRSTVAMRVARLSAPPTPFYPAAVEEEPFSVDGNPGNWDGCQATAA